MPNSQGNNKEAVTDKGEISAPTITLPKGGGAIRGMGEKFGANPVTGTGSMTVPIATSPGRSGFGPQLSLSYDSGAGNGPFGFGWSLSLPSITRKTDKGLPKYEDADESDVFILSGAEDLVPVFKTNPTTGEFVKDAKGNFVYDESPRDGYLVRRYRPRIEGLFARIERWTNQADPADTFWRSISKDNITTFYGKTLESRVADPADKSRVFQWLICESYDDKGNAIVYKYREENSDGVDLAQVHEKNRTPSSRSVNRYLKRIKYGNGQPNRDAGWNATDPARLPDSTWMFEVVFDYGEHYTENDQGQPTFVTIQDNQRQWEKRQDPFSSYRAGFEVRTYRLCQRVLMFHHFPDELGTADYLVRSTDFTYNPSPIASFITQVTQSGYVRQPDGNYLKKSLPPLAFEYTQAIVSEEIQVVDPESLQNLPAGADGLHYQWLDLDGEGLQGVLSEQQDAWYYKRNLSPISVVKENGKEKVVARFEPLVQVSAHPSIAEGMGARHQFLDLAGDGQLDLVQFETPVSGFYERTHDEQWDSFIPFDSVPNLAWNDPNLKFLDLTGDGHADILITEDDALTWYPSLAEEGFGTAIRIPKPHDEEEGPAVVFADGTQAIFVADISGDGLTDIVRIRNGEVCYWPNLGYGRFGAKVTMDNAPWFDAPDQFDQRRIRLADIDGSGVTDIIYLGSDGVRLYFNQSGNGWSRAKTLDVFPRVDNLSSIQAVDLLGNGTACLVWSSLLAGDARRPMRYLDLMGGIKPHLLVKVVNNLGAETQVQYAPSTKFYLADKLAGTPWITRLPFPVHVVERVTTWDHVSRNRFVTGYAYHHGYFDGPEREFRGFGMVEQLDTETFAALTEDDTLPEATNIDEASHVPPVLTRTWFHTGAFLDESRISKQFEHEYYLEGDTNEALAGLTAAQLRALLLDDTLLPSTLRRADGTRMPYSLSTEEVLEACRALKGAILRQEIYALDGTDEADRPYSTSERNYTIELVQPRDGNQHAVFFTNAREQVDFHYERKLVMVGGQKRADPRMSHALTLEVDPLGNVLRSVAIGYRRRDLPGVDAPEQKQTHFTFTVNRFANRPDERDWYRVGLPVETRTYEIVKPPEPTITDTRIDLFNFEQIATLTANLFPLDQPDPPAAKLWPYEKWDWHRNPANAPPDTRLRLIEHVRTLYRRDDLSGPLALEEVESRALPFENYKLAFTAALAEQAFVDSGKLTAAELDDALRREGKYVHSERHADWWIPSGQVFYSPGSNDTAAQELAHARTHFFLPHRYRDPFHTDRMSTETVVTFDDYRLLVVETRDALGNAVRAQNEYRVLAPRLITDPNGNRAEAAFDALGMVAGTAVMGKVSETLGDTLTRFAADLTDVQVEGFYDALDPHVPAPDLLKRATTRIIYDLNRFRRTQQARPRDPKQWMPVYAATLARETHASDPVPRGGLKIQINFSYSDGFGREIQKKIQAEPGPLVEGGPAVSPRWVGSGWTIFNNKGKPVRKYEPFFSTLAERRHRFEFARREGVSLILCYDPLERVVATLYPNHTYEKVVFDPWRQETWDANDTVLLDPRTDDDVRDFFRHLPDSEYLPTWYGRRIGGDYGDAPEQREAERQAAQKTARHAATPTIAYFDTLGRTFLTVENNGATVEEHYLTRVELDIEGNQREVIDAKGRAVMRFSYDILGSRIKQDSMDAGTRWVLNDVAGKPIYRWDGRGDTVRMTYDELQRPTEAFLRREAGAEQLVERTVYGETQGDVLNHRGRIYKQFDGAGVITNEAYDVKGNLLRGSRRLAADYKNPPNWAASVGLEEETFTSSTTYDALNRPVTLTMPDNSVIRPAYNEANLLERVEANLHGSRTVAVFINDIDYNAKGQRGLIEYGNRVRTTYKYDSETFQLIHLETRRGAERLQDLFYTYDPVGNITKIRDDAEQTIYFRNAVVGPHAEYTYDAIYRLIFATGREHIGQVSRPETTWNDEFRVNLAHPHDGRAMRRYTERYEYDEVGNILRLVHGADEGNWTRAFLYNEPSLVQPDFANNRLTRATVGETVEPFTHDAHGNMTRMLHLPLMQWDYKDQLQATSRQVRTDGDTPEITYYIYDASGQRVRKVTERQAAAGERPTRKSERIYLGGFELYREYNGGGTTVELERKTLHIMDDKQRIAMVETRTRGDDGSAGQLIRYQLGNHLGSASVELDDHTQIISYEEYYPYGSTSYQAMNSAIRAAAKRDRYTGMERDEETGLHYGEARYYMQWLGRSVSPDPAGMSDGANLYAYVRDNPLRFSDPSGTQTLDEVLGDVRAALTRARDTIERLNDILDRVGRAVRQYNEALPRYLAAARRGDIAATEQFGAIVNRNQQVLEASGARVERLTASALQQAPEVGGLRGTLEIAADPSLNRPQTPAEWNRMFEVGQSGEVPELDQALGEAETRLNEALDDVLPELRVHQAEAAGLARDFQELGYAGEQIEARAAGPRIPPPRIPPPRGGGTPPAGSSPPAGAQNTPPAGRGSGTPTTREAHPVPEPDARVQPQPPEALQVREAAPPRGSVRPSFRGVGRSILRGGGAAVGAYPIATASNHEEAWFEVTLYFLCSRSWLGALACVLTQVPHD